MRYYPVNLDIQNRNCLVVGGGSVGTRKVTTLVNCGALVTVVSPEATDRLLEMAASGSIELKKRVFRPSDLDGIFLVVGATDDEELNREIHTNAERLGILCNIADRPEACNFILPSIVNRGDLIIAISTSGKSPAFAKKLRKELEKKFGNEYAGLLELMGAIRKKLLSAKHEPEAHKHLFEQLLDRDLLVLVKEGKNDDINALLYEILGEGYKIENLI
jgi:precorrin-2 dehydrogenase/sirohydrochlorin ferrochelatase